MFNRIENYFRQKEIVKTGVFLGEITEGKPHMRALICALRGFMIFLGTYGTIIGVLEAFGLPYNNMIVAPAIFLLSMYMAFLYFHKLFFYPGYFLLLGAFTYELAHMYLYANSGYQAIINEIYLAYSDYFKLLSVREAQEIISQREITVTVAAIFLGTFLAMMLNVTISGYMNLFESALVTLPLLEIAFYIEKKPPIYCICMVLAMYIFVGILQASRHQRMQVKGKHTHEFTRFARKNKKYYFYQGNAKGNLLAAVFAIVIAVLIGIFSFPNYQSKIEIYNHNPIRKKLDEYTKIYVQTGWTGWMNRYDNTGGMNSGRLGGIGEVRPDFETDLSVTFAPYTFSTMYLKGFTGSYYSQNQWFDHTFTGNVSLETTSGSDAESVSGDEIKTDAGENGNSTDVENSSVKIKKMLENNEIMRYDREYQPEAKATARMNIVNLDADPHFAYLPYFADYTKYSPFRKSESTSLEFENGVDITYNPNVELFYEVPSDYNGIDDPTYEYYVNQACTYVPDTLRPVLEEYIKEHNYFNTPAEGFSASENAGKYEDVNDYRLSMARAIYAHYVNEFKYTMAPGATPYSKDYVEYFLTTQKRGYCAHFASSGVMLLRSMGIPARYVEGYCIPTSLLAESGHGINEAYEEWYEGETLLDEKGVVNVPVNDSYAHAWIEIYMDGYGFVPFEMTIPSDDEETDTSGFGDLFSGLFNFRFNIAELPDPETAANTNNVNKTLSGLFNLNIEYQKFIIPVAIAAAVILLGLFGFLGIRSALYAKRLRTLYTNQAFAELVYIKYTSFTDFLLSKPGMRTNEDNPLPSDVLEQLKRLLKNRTPEITDESLEKLFAYIERALYSRNAGTKQEYDAFVTELNLIRKTLNRLK